MVKDLARAGVDPRVLVNCGTEPDMYLEISVPGYGRVLVRPHPPSAVSSDEPRGRNDRHGRRRRDPPVLERVPEEGQAREEREPFGLRPAHTLSLPLLPPSRQITHACERRDTRHQPSRAPILAPPAIVPTQAISTISVPLTTASQ